MLVLTRRRGEKLLLSGGIVIKVVSCGGGQVRLGVEAPLHVQVRRPDARRKKAMAVAAHDRAVPQKG